MSNFNKVGPKRKGLDIMNEVLPQSIKDIALRIVDALPDKAPDKNVRIALASVMLARCEDAAYFTEGERALRDTCLESVTEAYRWLTQQAGTNETPPGTLARTLMYLGAVEVEPGRYATNLPGFDSEPLPAYATFTTKDLNRFGVSLLIRRLREGVQPRMREWWSPKRQFQLRTSVLTHTFNSRDAAYHAAETGGYGERGIGWDVFTVNFETGEEVWV